MTRFKPLSLLTVTAALTMGWATPSIAQSAPETTAEPVAPAPADTVRLTDAQRDAILNGNTIDSAAAARGELTRSERQDRGIHGEMGVMIGSYGSHSIYGAAEIPLGDNAELRVMMESSRYGYRSSRR